MKKLVPQMHQTSYLYVISQFKLDDLAHAIAVYSRDKWKNLANSSFNSFVRNYVEEPTLDHVEMLLEQTHEQLPPLTVESKKALDDIGPTPFQELRQSRAQISTLKARVVELEKVHKFAKILVSDTRLINDGYFMSDLNDALRANKTEKEQS